ncbi:purine-binding chemotaxis protein CheW [Deferribacter desulfuricans SSM1]|uniref:Purine-binding chemotaxis protein CheW n=1 Tax=Deferribacter desulfuricans (strain DSM 14783 / JCM 11476 / NBRC 101012 / SSM1) TaxID=639282 RepID=D3PAQ1_DEFDS|nr:chemotaxis protein CheW [Deferribacter desulfuricans]BAI79674.1 purine-binding chemotaxis protein CheW [Deferribacter desulfuricans SSM1]
MIKELLNKKLKREVIVVKKDEKSFIQFKVGGISLLLDMSNVFVVLEYKQIVELPGAPSHILGIIYYQGEVIPIVDLKGIFNEATTFRTENTRFVIIKYNNELIGIFADEVLGIKNINKALLKQTDEDFFSATVKLSDEINKVIDIEKFYNKLKVS